MLSLSCCTIEWRVRRVAHFLRLLNAPRDSLQHISLIILRHLQTQWYRAALEDVRLIVPSAWIYLAEDALGPYLHSP
eukprot:7253060-Karenia_brevis.AAC.1